MKIRNSVGCSIDGIEENEFEKFKKVGWITEAEYLRLNPDEAEQTTDSLNLITTY